MALWSIVALLIVHFGRFTTSAAVRPSDGFLAYFTASRLVYEDVAAQRFYDDAWFREQTLRFNPDTNDIFNVNPPTTSLMMLPFAGFEYRPARILWTAVSLLCLAAGVYVVMCELQFEGLWVPAAIGVVLGYNPLYANVEFGQAYVLLFVLLVVGWYGYRRQRDGLLGCALGLMLVLKSAGVLLWPLLLLSRRWRALVWGGATVLLVVLGTLPLVGVEAWRTYTELLPTISRQPWVAVTAQQTQLGLLRHLFTFDPDWNPAPLWQAPMVSTGLIVVTGLMALGAGALYALRQIRPDSAFGLFAVLTVVLAPVALEYHYVLMLLPAAIAAVLVHGRDEWWLWASLAVALGLIAIDMPYQSPRLTRGAWALLAYPRLYGAWLLWGVILVAASDVQARTEYTRQHDERYRNESG